MSVAISLSLVTYFLCVSFLFLGNSIATIAKWAMKYPFDFLMDITIKTPTFFLVLAVSVSNYYEWLSILCLVGMLISFICLRIGLPNDYHLDIDNPPPGVNLDDDL